MAHPRIKSENFENLGGINTKANAYLTGPREALDIRNCDFSVPGALTKRPGSTMYIGQTFSSKITTILEYEKLNGFSQILVTTSSGIWAGTTSPVTGFSLTANGGTYISSYFPIYGSTTMGDTLTVYTSALNKDNAYVWYQAGLGFVSASGSGIQPEGITLVGSIYGGQILQPSSFGKPSLKTFQDSVYINSSNMFAKYNGSSLSMAIPPPAIAFVETVSTSSPASGVTTGWGIGFNYVFFGSLVNTSGARGPLVAIGAVDADIASGASTPISFEYKFSILAPPQYGITAMDLLVWRGSSGSIVSASQTKFVTTLPIYPGTYSGGTYPIVSTIGSISHGTSLFSFLAPADMSLYPDVTFGETILSSYVTKRYDGVTLSLNNVWVNTNQDQPIYSEIYQNRMFLSGRAGAPSTIWFSDLARPEYFDPTFNFDVRTNDGDVVTGMHNYQNNLMIFKSRSTHELTGDAPENFVLRQISADYGCVNNQCAVTWKQKIWFLDRKGIIEFNGANVDVASTKIEPFFNSVNWTAAKTEACMLHNKPRNEIWCAVPVNGATLNNAIAVFDYIMEAWSIWDGPSPSCFAMIKQANNREIGFMGDNQGRVNYFGNSLMGDNGSGITMLMKSRFEHPEGQSVEKQFRRLFVNADSLLGSTTFNVGLEFYKNYGTSLALGQTISQTAFQKYTNFGISAKSLSIQISHFSNADAIRLHGYVLEYRYQRNT